MGDIYDDKIHRWLNHEPGAPPPEDEELQRAAEATKGLTVPAKRSKAEAWAMLEAQLGAEEGTAEEAPVVPISKNKRRLSPALAVAASIALVLAAYFILRSGSPADSDAMMTVVATEKAATQQLALPDASEVTMNADTRLEYLDAASWESTRTVKLEGEAFFKVAKGQTFTVETPKGSVQVLGTEFNVYARENGFRVACQEGKVAVTSPTGESVTLTAGQTASLSEGTLTLDENLNASQMTAWQQGTFFFHEASYAEVFAELARQYGIVIQNEVDESATFTGSFDQGDLNTALDFVTLPNLLEYEQVSTDTVVIRD